MRILLTGASSFTGFWFAKALNEAGHEVIAPLRGTADSYQQGERAKRVQQLGKYACIVWSTSFGDDRFLELAAGGRFDTLCHHAAQVGDYRSETFDVSAALAANTRALLAVLTALTDGGLNRVVLTGSVFEQDEGAGESPLHAFSPYGLSKGLTAEVFRHWCAKLRVPLRKFVIPNPFGPHEEPRFCAYLLKTWRAGDVAVVRTPDYIRDNIHVDLLAKAYTKFACGDDDAAAFQSLNPSGYVESQGAFAQRFALEMSQRLGLHCRVDFSTQTDFSEPLMRVNTQNARVYVGEWNEQTSWNELASFYDAEYLTPGKT